MSGRHVRVHEWPEDNPFQACVMPSQWEVTYTSAERYIEISKIRNSYSQLIHKGVPHEQVRERMAWQDTGKSSSHKHECVNNITDIISLLLTMMVNSNECIVLH